MNLLIYQFVLRLRTLPRYFLEEGPVVLEYNTYYLHCYLYIIGQPT